MGMIPLRRAALAVGMLYLSACSDRTAVTAPWEQPAEPTTIDVPNTLASVTCRGSVAAGTIACSQPSLASATAPEEIIVGGQGMYVRLESSNIVSNAGTFAFDVTVENLIPQPLGTPDGTTVDPAGVRVFFQSGPTVTVGTGTMSVANPTGTHEFLASAVPYYQYDGILATGDTTAPLRWELAFDPGVDEFEIRMYVAAMVEFPDGFVDMDMPVGMTTAVVDEGSTIALAATAMTAVGNVMPEPMTWLSTDTTVATVDASGMVTGIADGVVDIIASNGVVADTMSLSVCPVLAVGETFEQDLADGPASLCLSGFAGTAEYTISPVNHSATSSVSITTTATGLNGSGVVAVSGPPSPLLAGARLAPEFVTEYHDPTHMDRLAEDAALMRLLGKRGRIDADAPAANGMSSVITPGVPAVGDLWNLNVAGGCNGTADNRVARVVSMGQSIIIVSDTTNPAGGFTTAQYDSIAAEFDSIAQPVNVDNFGAPTDLDGNSRVVAFYTRAVNELSPPASSVVTLGYVTARDLYSSAPGSCTLSNEGEMFYMLVPDPTGAVNSNVRTVSSVRGQTVGTLAHEYQHLINASRRIYVNEAPVTEEVWLNEGLSHIAEELMFYRASFGLAPRGNINLSSLTTGPTASRRVAAFNTYANANYGRLRSFLQRPDTVGPLKTNDVLATRGATWALLRYAADRHNGTESTFWFDLVNSQTSGRANLAAVTGANVEEWTRDFIMAMYADDAVVGAGTIYQQPSWNFRSIYGGLGGFPLGIRHLSNGVPTTLSFSRGGATAYFRTAVPAAQHATITVSQASQGKLVIMRTK